MKKLLQGCFLLFFLPALGAQYDLGSRSFYQPSGGGGSTHTHIQSMACQASGSVSSLTCTGSTIAAGDLLQVTTTNALGGIGTPTFTGDSGSFVADMPLNTVTYSSFQSYMSSFYVLSAGGGGNSITMTASGIFYGDLKVDEFHCSPACVLDVNDNPSPGVAVGASTVPASASITPTAGDLVLATVSPGVSITPTWAAGTGFTLGATSTYTAANEYMLSAPGSSVSAGFTPSVSYWADHVVAFK